MKLKLLCVGRLSEAYLRAGVEDFAARVQRYLPLEIIEIKEEKAGGRKPDTERIRAREGERLLAKVADAAQVVILDEGGRRMSSEKLAQFLEDHMVRATPEIAFILGGAYGLAEAVRQRGNLILSLSDMTFTHQMARLFLLEQIYRGLTIVRNEPYHNR
ncbi:23S rRNA (pseudouridine1915-N3)-methyltransferase [Geoalkalibacter ferrihydriticus]|uniref:Ribosomal RNA large subunit methyltransferase H n=2 Tax=Geoalkalibacter ferrihydriticus TaxID=392333 RepID=A0A0C2HTD5_9BACT|nr:23S rRNA (pseudouridine(1915)-N(3))-methyltransferase RlmH [Geoalkalibacter ferrihydriticus]KIH76072.1 50S rRNA methyltransferase [Geoalkalibacter ferrihydriticus DSM 17813]SDM46847.1 23S rRNA (pseudouridine1915-N3)-methyltransferase [Geoalkalibacter ferrihydriticus]